MSRSHSSTRVALALFAVLTTGLIATPRAAHALAYDIILVLDVTGSTGALLPGWQADADTKFIQPIQAAYPGSRFALVSHRDFPFNPYGGPFDYAFRLESPLNANTAPFLAAMNALTDGGGNDDPESQYVALTLSLTGDGIDLDGANPVEYGDPGDIAPTNIGLPGGNPVAVYHFTWPALFHNRDTEPNYPFAGSAAVPGYNDAAAAIVGAGVTYIGLVTGPLRPGPGGISPQTGKPVVFPTGPSDPVTQLAELSGGAVYDVGGDLSGLEDAIEQSLTELGPPAPIAAPQPLAAAVGVMMLMGAYMLVRHMRVA